MKNMNVVEMIEDGNLIHVVEVLDDAVDSVAAEQATAAEVKKLRTDFANFMGRQEDANHNLAQIPKMLEEHKRGIESITKTVEKHGKAMEYLLKTVNHHGRLIPCLQRKVEQVDRRLERMEVKVDQLAKRIPTERNGGPSNNNSSTARSRRTEPIQCQFCQKTLQRKNLGRHINRISCPVLKARMNQNTGAGESAAASSK